MSGGVGNFPFAIIETMRIWPGKSYPLGATYDGEGVNFAIFSEKATKVVLCLFDSTDATAEYARVTFTEYTDNVWHAYLPDIKPGQLYGYRVFGAYDPFNGSFFNSNKIMLDPYAKAVARDFKWETKMFGYNYLTGQVHSEILEPDLHDNADSALLSVVIDCAFDWGTDTPPDIPWNETIIYETHVKGFSIRHPEVEDPQRGTYLALGSPPAIEHFKKLGITAVELLPIHYKVDEWHLHQKRLTNYWGYNTISYFAPDNRFSMTPHLWQDTIDEFKTMVKNLHSAGIEVILDVVYNHTAEGDQFGPTISFRGIDNRAYYRLDLNRPGYYQDFTGCGNSLNMNHPRVIQLMMDSLRYWVTEMHVDGFRFDLASALARELFEVDRLSAFFDVIHQDPIVSRVKLIAEPWDVGEGGYQVGNFPVLWTEWNGRYRDAVRRFWKGTDGLIGKIATRISGSSDLYGQGARKPYASINFVTAHDGFTLQDLVSYETKHNEDNYENNRDGENFNNSWNCGAEGQTYDEEINRIRLRQKRNFLATLMFSSGVPMLSGGDELGRTQRGNNNAYCQDNEISWYNWDLGEENKQFLQFVQDLIHFRKSQPVLRRRKFFDGLKKTIYSGRDVTWYNTSGCEMLTIDWHNPMLKTIGVCFAGDAIDETDKYGQRINGDTLLYYINAAPHRQEVILPERKRLARWELLLDTRLESFLKKPENFMPTAGYIMEAWSIAMFRMEVLSSRKSLADNLAQ